MKVFEFHQANGKETVFNLELVKKIELLPEEKGLWQIKLYYCQIAQRGMFNCDNTGEIWAGEMHEDLLFEDEQTARKIYYTMINIMKEDN